MADIILNREDNPIYRHLMIRNILTMYYDEVRKALVDGESILIPGVGTIIPELKINRGKYNMPNCNCNNEGENPPPITKLRIYRNRKLELDMNNRLKKNLLEGIWGLKNRFFPPTDFEYLKSIGYIPEDAELTTEYEEDDYDEC